MNEMNTSMGGSPPGSLTPLDENQRQELHTIFESWLRHQRLLRALSWAGGGLLLGAVLALISGVALTWSARLLPQELILLSAALLVAGLLAGGLAGLLWPLAPMPAARHFDRQFGLRERLSTALELAQISPSPPLSDLQLADTLAHARAVELSRALPLRLPWRNLGTAALLCVLLAGAAWGLRGQFQAAQQARQLEQAIQAEIEGIEALATRIEQVDMLDPQAQEAILQSLEATLQDLQAAESAEEALSALAEGQAELQSLISPDSLATLQAMDQAGTALSQSSNNDLQAAGAALSQGDAAAAAQALENLDISQLSAAELEQLAGQLAAAAQALQASQPAAAAALQNAANALQSAASANSAQAAQAAQAALQQAAGNLQALQNQLQAGQAAMQAAQGLAQAQANLATGTGTAMGQGNTPGAGAGSTSTQSSGSGSGAGRGEGDGSEGNGGQTAGTTPIQTSNGPGDGGLTPYDSLYVPQRLSGEDGADVSLPGGNTPGETVVGAQERPSSDPGGLQVPYVDALPYYEAVNRQAIDSGQVPLDLRELVRRYFSALEP
jgi:hypothetical protein